MKSSAIAFLLAFPSAASSSSAKKHLRQETGEARQLNKLSWFIWITTDDDSSDDGIATSTTSSTLASSTTTISSTATVTDAETSSSSSSTTNFMNDISIDWETIATLPAATSTTEQSKTTDVISTTTTIPTTVTQSVSTSTLEPVNNPWIASCSTDTDCYPKLRVQIPGNSETIGAGICGCYADSINDPFDECQGDTECAIAGCFRNTCDGFSAYCSEDGVCMLLQESNENDEIGIDSAESTTTSPTTTSSTTEAVLETGMPTWCNNDSDCSINFICSDQSNGKCFSPPCGRCIESNENGEIGIDSAETTTSSTTSMPTWCSNDSDCSENLICSDQSNGMCFSPPCGRCTNPSDSIYGATLNQDAMSIPMQDATFDENVFAFLDEPK